MVTRRAILALLLAASPALAFPPSALDDMMAGLVATVGGGGYTDAVQADARLLFRVTTLDATSYTLAGTNLASWTDIKGGIVCTAPVTNARPWIAENDLGTYAGFGFGGGQYLDLATPIPASNVMIVAVGYRATQNTMWTIMSHTNTAAGPAVAPWSDGITYYSPANPQERGASWNLAGISNRILLAFAHFGGMPTTNNIHFFNNTNRVGNTSIGAQVSSAAVFNRIGARKSDGYAVGRFNDISVWGDITDTNAMLEIINKVKEVWGI